MLLVLFGQQGACLQPAQAVHLDISCHGSHNSTQRQICFFLMDEFKIKLDSSDTTNKFK
jgi:hypothetical protein